MGAVRSANVIRLCALSLPKDRAQRGDATALHRDVDFKGLKARGRISSAGARALCAFGRIQGIVNTAIIQQRAIAIADAKMKAALRSSDTHAYPIVLTRYIPRM